MKKTAIISCILTLATGFAIGLYDYYGMSRSGAIWGMYGVTFLKVGGFFGVAGVALICFHKLREYGKGVLLAGLLLLLFGGSVCSGYIRF